MPAFLVGPVWFLYRKMWLMAVVIIGLLVVLAFLPVTSRASLPLAVVLGLMGRQTYVQHAIGAIQKARRTRAGLDSGTIAHMGACRKQQVDQRRHLLLAILAVAAMIVLVRSGQPAPQ